MMQKEIKRWFILGDEWLYYKIYGGSQTSEELLININNVTEELLNQEIIDKWFYINYSDPDRHIRVRFHLKNENINYLIQILNQTFHPLVENKLIHDIQTNTYKREIERYGYTTIEEFESLFFFNSQLVLKILQLVDGDANKRWLFTLKAIDSFLDEWEINLNARGELFNFLARSFAEEMNSSKSINRQLSKKYRTHRDIIEQVIQSGDSALNIFLAQHNVQSQPSVEAILENPQVDRERKYDFMRSYLHMFCNRIFSSRQRMNEWIVYYFLSKFYASKIAKEKKGLISS